MAYGSTEDKQKGIRRESVVAKRILDYFNSTKLKVKMDHSTLLEDMRQKFDYVYTCERGQSFSKKEKISEIKVDIKCGKTYTMIDENGNNNLEKSEADYIVFELYENADKLLWINTGKLKQCIGKRYPELRLSKEEGNKSRYFFIEEYIKNNEKFLDKFYSYI